MDYLRRFYYMNSRVKWFWFNTFLYMILTVVTTLYAYARLDFVRSYDTSSEIIDNHHNPAADNEQRT